MKQETILATLSPYEASILKGTKNSKADAIVADKRTRAILDNMLNCKCMTKLPDGTDVEASIEELLIAGAISYELHNPKGLETIERLAKIRGEVGEKNAMEVSVSLVDKDLSQRAIE